MCGRFSLITPLDEVAEHFSLKEQLTLQPRYNIAPCQEILVMRMHTDSRYIVPGMLRWGLIPHWSKDQKIGYKLINARAETVAEKPSFREVFKSRRCLIPADGFFEWKKVGRRKQAYYIRMKNSSVFAFAGLWEAWRDSEGGYHQNLRDHHHRAKWGR